MGLAYSGNGLRLYYSPNVTAEIAESVRCSARTKYAETNEPHARMTERVIAPERLDFVDVVAFSQNHTDRLDWETLISL